MSSSALFFNRLVKGWKFQYGVIKLVADWTVLLYLIIPSVVIFIFVYRSWWSEVPSWIEGFPMFLLFILLYLLSWSGNIRTYIEEADKVFLIKKFDYIWNLKKWGYSYSIFYQSMVIVGAIVLLLPFLLNHYQLDWQSIIALLIYFSSLKACLMLVKYQFKKIESRWKKIAIGSLCFILFSWFSQLIYLLFEKEILLSLYLFGWIIFLISIYLSLRTLRKISSLDIEIDMEKERKTSTIQFIFMAAPEIEKPAVTKRTKPLLFRRSKQIFKKRTPMNGYIELFIKIFIRNYSYISGYFVLINVTTAAIVLIPPIWIKVLILLGFLLMMHSWISLIWDKVFSSNPLMKKYKENTAYFSAKKKAVTTMYIVALLILLVFILLTVSITSKMGINYGI
jgi:ABC-2 type transport system permease protein